MVLWMVIFGRFFRQSAEWPAAECDATWVHARATVLQPSYTSSHTEKTILFFIYHHLPNQNPYNSNAATQASSRGMLWCLISVALITQLILCYRDYQLHH